MAKNRCVIMRQTITIAAAIIMAVSVFYSVVLNPAVSKLVGLCLYQYAEDSVCMESCCSGTETFSGCCCYFSETPNQTDSLVSYESFDKSIYNYMCTVHTYDKTNLAVLYVLDYETQFNPNNINYEIFKPPKA